MRLGSHLHYYVWLLILSLLLPVHHSGHLACRPHGKDLIGEMENGDKMIGPVLPIHLDIEYPKIHFTERRPQEKCVMLGSHLHYYVWLLILSLLLPVHHSGHLACRPHGKDLIGEMENGDMMIGAVLPIHRDMEYPKINFRERPPQGKCVMFSFDVFQQFHTMRFTIEEINRSPDLLPNLTFGFHVYDSCASLHRALDGTMKLLTGTNQGIPNVSCQKWPHLLAIIGHSVSSFSIPNAQILGLYRFPQISHFSTSSLLSDKKQFPSFFRTVPSDVFQSKGLAELVLHFGWTWVGLVGVSDEYGQQGIQIIKEELVRAGACVAFTEYIMANLLEKIPRLANVIRESTARAIIAFVRDTEMVLLLDEMLRQNVTGKIFVASEAWANSILLSVDKYSTILSGSIGFSFLGSTIPKLEPYLRSVHPFNVPGQSWTKIFWENTFGCTFFGQGTPRESWNNSTRFCTGNENPESIQNGFYDVSSLRSAYNLYMAIHIIAQALHDLHTCPERKGPFYNGNCADLYHFESWQLTHYMQNVHLKLTNGREIFFDKNGDPPAQYDILNWQVNSNGALRPEKVGNYDTTKADRMFTVNMSAVRWTSDQGQVPLSICSPSCPPGLRKLLRTDVPVCCFECISCPPGEVSNKTDSVDCFKCSWDTWPNVDKDRCIPKSRDFLSFKEPLGATLTVISVFSSIIPASTFGLFIFYKNTPVVRANNYNVSCLLLVSLFLCFLSSLAFIGYPHPNKCLLRQTAFGMVFVLCISCILAKTVMVVFAFMATKPGSSLRKWASPRVSYSIIFSSTLLQLLLCISWVVLDPPFPEENTQSQPGVIILECNEGSKTAFWCMLGYLGFLATISLFVAFLARRLPDSFNEAKFITFSLLTFLSVWVSFIPAYLSASGKYTVAMEIFAIQSSSWALVICMFLPKCFIILFRPDMNSKQHLMGKTNS